MAPRHRIEFLYRRSEVIDSGIEYIGGNNANGTRWKITVERAIEGILSGKWSFYIQQGGRQLDICVVNDSNGRMKLCINTSNIDYVDIM